MVLVYNLFIRPWSYDPDFTVRIRVDEYSITIDAILHYMTTMTARVFLVIIFHLKHAEKINLALISIFFEASTLEK